MLQPTLNSAIAQRGCEEVTARDEELLRIILPELTGIKTVFLQALSKLRQELEPRIAALENQRASTRSSSSPQRYRGDSHTCLAKKPWQDSNAADWITPENDIQPSRSSLAEAASRSFHRQPCSEESTNARREEDMARPRLAPWPACAPVAALSLTHQPRMAVSQEWPGELAAHVQDPLLRPRAPSPNNSRSCTGNFDDPGSSSPPGPCRRPCSPKRSNSFPGKPSVLSVDDVQLQRQETDSSDSESTQVKLTSMGSSRAASLNDETAWHAAGVAEGGCVLHAMETRIRHEPRAVTKLASHHATAAASQLQVDGANSDGNSGGDAVSTRDPSGLAGKAQVHQLARQRRGSHSPQREIMTPPAENVSSAGNPQLLIEPISAIRNMAPKQAVSPRSHSAPLAKLRVVPPCWTIGAHSLQMPAQPATVCSWSTNMVLAANKGSASAAMHANSCAAPTSTAIVTLARRPADTPRGTPCASPAVPCMSTASTPITVPCGSPPWSGPGLFWGAPGASAAPFSQNRPDVPYAVFQSSCRDGEK
eukprot:TRINITY_DN106273_c0_g1_i1.p1 TRINITY_DN106273_c0_g1~~TRINITY_DN106273_c0_g1_i1.p1  ORF type:complete len:584 (-),score=57.14 TRINITY_DN106273_c0_g1_i1:65-1672(-)